MNIKEFIEIIGEDEAYWEQTEVYVNGKPADDVSLLRRSEIREYYKGHIYKTRVGSNPYLSEFTGCCDHCNDKANCPDFTPKTKKDENA